MGDILAVWDEYRQIQWAAVIQEMQGQRADEQGILHPAWAFGKELLLPKVLFVFYWESTNTKKDTEEIALNISS